MTEILLRGSSDEIESLGFQMQDTPLTACVSRTQRHLANIHTAPRTRAVWICSLMCNFYFKQSDADYPRNSIVTDLKWLPSFATVIEGMML